VWHNYFSLRDARVENQHLRTELAESKDAWLKAQEEVKLAQQLRALVNWPAPQPYIKVTARVVSRDANQWFNTVVIDRGTLSGISKDQPVVTPEGLVGRVIDVAPNAARVLLMTDERHGAGALIGQLTESRLLGVVRGRNNYLCEMKFVAGTEDIKPGETAITSGKDGLYPAGLVIGRVTRVEKGSPTTPFLIEIEPAAPLAKLDVVGVLLVPKEQIHGPADEFRNQEKPEKPSKPSRRR